MTRCFIALGSNLDNPLRQVTTAVTELSQLQACQVSQCSPWYYSKAIGPDGQPDYINGVVELETDLPAMALLRQLQAIEQQHQRQRLQHWGPRTLDLDLLLYGNAIINQAELTVPHPQMQQRNFVLYPLFDIAADLHLPDGATLRSLLADCPRDDLRPVDAGHPQQ